MNYGNNMLGKWTTQVDNSGNTNKSLYQPIIDNSKPPKQRDSIIRLAGESGDTLESWRSRIENRVLHLNKLTKEEVTTLLNTKAPNSSIRLPYSKFSGLSNKASKATGLLSLKDTIPYESATKLHELWLEYAKGIIGTNNHLNACKSLALLDLQGAKVDIIKSSCPTYVGISGIIIRETQNGFNIVNQLSQLKFVLKKQTVFQIRLGDWTFFVHGQHIVATPSQRSKKKLKGKVTL
ncbi:conserved hypothetical protein [Theileria equi strain WA]|uniref:Uncharacterized protein n=1 Tax=Theileria equi strain WA TaxID=1537102 RepID=L1LGK9_THEEQ|nr:conserved hypothetical protein [Theileria equi strain WA]EKX74253.1 conserved hypothetical protein [Theileria equi strain WA]|eukprot:XP_004833705.1 conserved hypothetical protein [Theileria equi strain WA]